jgi:hypothetical protein
LVIREASRPSWADAAGPKTAAGTIEAVSCLPCDTTITAGSDARPVILPDPKHRDEMMMIAAPVCPARWQLPIQVRYARSSRFCEKISGGTAPVASTVLPRLNELDKRHLMQHFGRHLAQFVAENLIAVIVGTGDTCHVLWPGGEGVAGQVAQGGAAAIPLADHPGPRRVDKAK